jgi:hypothetical protein
MKKSHDPLHDSKVERFLEQILHEITWKRISQIKHKDVELIWRQWLTNDTYCPVLALEHFKYASFCAGTTPAFGEFIARNHQKRIRVSQSDFVLTNILARTHTREIVYIEQEPLAVGDCMIVSQPFSGNGSQCPGLERLLEQACELNVPVMIDGAYAGLGCNTSINLDWNCITDFVTSLTKNFVSHNMRLGMRFTRQPVDDTLSAGIIAWEMYDRYGAAVSIELLKKFPQKDFIDKYLPYRDQICQTFDLTPTNTITLCLGDNRYKEFKRGDFNRVCITDELIDLSTKG